jgi:hypothetical protein
MPSGVETKDTSQMKLVSTRTAAAAGTITLGVWLGLGSGLGYAASPSQTSCESAGGTFFKVNGSVVCTFTVVDPVGNSESSGGKSQTRDTTTADGGQGNLSYKETTTSSCVGPGNAKCS